MTSKNISTMDIVARRAQLDAKQKQFLETLIRDVRSGVECPGWGGVEATINKELDKMLK